MRAQHSDGWTQKRHHKANSHHNHLLLHILWVKVQTKRNQKEQERRQIDGEGFDIVPVVVNFFGRHVDLLLLCISESVCLVLERYKM